MPLQVSTQKHARHEEDPDSEAASPKRSRMNPPPSNAVVGVGQGFSDRATSPMTPSRQSTTTTTTSSPETSDRDTHTSRASNPNNNPNHLRRNLARHSQPRLRPQPPEDPDQTSSSGESTSSESDSSSSSEDEDENTDNEDLDSTRHDSPTLAHLPTRQKPRIHRVDKTPDILSRVSSFLPKLKVANESLQKDIEAGRGGDARLDDVDDAHEGRYIEMNLGLGVLEEKREDDSSSEDDEMGGVGPDDQKRNSKDSNVLDTLMGNEESTVKRPTIEEMNQ